MSDGGVAPEYEWSPCHGHYHFKGYATYELLAAASDDVVAIGRKQAFCLMDILKTDPNAGPAKFTCGNQGITAGWADVYDKSLDCQWIDITGVDRGDYRLRVTINAAQTLPETDYTNNTVIVPVHVK